MSNRHAVARLVAAAAPLLMRRAAAGNQQGYRYFKGQQPTGRLRRLWLLVQQPRFLLVTGAVSAYGGVYYYQHIDYAPYTSRRRMIDVTRESEQQLGRQEFEQMKRQMGASAFGRFSPYVRRVTDVGKRIAKVADQPDFQWEFVVFDKPEPNAFCLPGGKIGVFSGLFTLVKTDDELAAVIAHEVGHAVARHGAERLSSMTLLLPLQLLLYMVMDTYLLNRLLVLLLFELPCSRRLESEADVIGLKLMTKACYDPRASPEIFRKLGQYAERMGAKVPAYLSTHPADKSRVKDLTARLPESLKEYRESCPAGGGMSRLFRGDEDSGGGRRVLWL